ncbi:Ferrochelatase-like protein [Leptomonas seymouri]|uniref:Ferrochelatase n=1 Tax=Leptomonas seymouri TaxID=5684 RepID=A0A0N0P7R7_LEPSE|nr:Ferrochelatase-like protein [Leptomonas seymouri]|eukprot:KPI89099.1 Ferrochelatase-like protein [Leptomonas seymouri]
MSSASKPSKAVLLVNLGTCTAPTAAALCRFLREFLSDRRVVDVPRFIWFPILYGIILPFRSYKIVPLYSRVWIKKDSGVVINGKTEGSPLALYTESLAEKVRTVVEAQSHGDVVVRLAMRYGARNIPLALQTLHEEFPSVRELVVVPLFPQYSSTTSASVYDAVFRFYVEWGRRCIPGIRTVRDYAEHPVYIKSIATTLLDAMRKHTTANGAATGSSWKASLIQLLQKAAVLISYHSIPMRYVETGDDYPQRCWATTRAVQAYVEKETGISFADSIAHVYQSQLGSQPWLGPKLTEAVAALPAPSNAAHKQIFCKACHNMALLAKETKVCFAMTPGFAVDCVETLHEVAEDAGELFMEHGGSEFIYVPCLNDNAAHVETIAAVLKAEV